jgi:hypothetical protein
VAEYRNRHYAIVHWVVEGASYLSNR